MNENETPKTPAAPDARPEPPANLARPDMRDKPTVILGGGPAGLTAGYLLAKQGLPVVVLEAEDQVGGIAKTVVARRLPLRPRRPPLLHEGRRRSTTSGTRSCARSS